MQWLVMHIQEHHWNPLALLLVAHKIYAIAVIGKMYMLDTSK